MPLPRAHFLGLFFFTLAWLAYDHYRPWVNFHSELLAFVGLLGLAIGVLRRPGAVLASPRASLGIAILALVPWLQYATGISLFAGDALICSMYLLGLSVAVFVGYSLGLASADPALPGLDTWMHALWIAALASAAIGLAQWFDVQGPIGMYVVQTDFGDRAMGNLGQPNQLATLLLIGIAAFAYSHERGSIGRLPFILGLGFLTAVLVLTRSRTGMLSVLVLTTFLLWKRRTHTIGFSASAILAWAVCFIIGTLSLPWVSDALLLGDIRALSSSEAISQRWRIWQQVGYAVLQSPWFGYGWNQTPTAHAVGAVAFPGDFTYTNAHDFVLDMLAWNGMPLGLLISATVLFWFVSRLRACAQPAAIYALAGLLALAVHSLLEYPYAYAYFLLSAGILVGTVEAATRPGRTIALKARWAWALVALWIPTGAYLCYEYFLVEEDFRVVRFENLRVGRTPPGYEVPRIWMLSQMASMLKAARQTTEPGMNAADIDNMRKASMRFAFGTLHLRYTLALALNGDLAGAKHQLVIIRSMYGEYYYGACIAELRRLENEKYPQLAALLAL